jgi:hypothetical protein
MAAHTTPAQRKEMQRLKAQGFTNLAIAERMGLDRHTVGRHVDPDEARGQSTHATERAKLEYLLAGFNMQGTCFRCKKVAFWNERQTTGFCNWCGTKWASVRMDPPNAV